MYVCSCRAVTDREIGAAIADGACSLLGVARRCGAGITCGGCQPALRQMLADRGHPCPRAESLRTLRALVETGLDACLDADLAAGPRAAPAPA